MHGLDLPSSPLDSSKKANIRITQHHGFSANSLPGSYGGAIVEIDPADSNIIWNTAADCWMVTYEVNGFSGFFLASFGNNSKTIADGNWNDPAIWENNKIPSSTSDVTITKNVVVTANAICRSLKIVKPAILIVQPAVTLKILN